MRLDRKATTPSGSAITKPAATAISGRSMCWTRSGPMSGRWRLSQSQRSQGSLASSSIRLRYPQLIRLEAVRKEFPGQTVAVDHLDLEIADGETCVLLGPSGCGKTTTLRMINRLIEPT